DWAADGDHNNITLGINGVLARIPNLATLDATGWDLSKTGAPGNYNGRDTIGAWFSNLTNLTTLNATDWKFAATTGASRGTSAQGLLSGTKLASVDVTGWKTANVTDLSNLFRNTGGTNDTTNLATITGLDTWDTHSATTMNGMFQDQTKLTTLDLHTWDTHSLTNTNSMFAGCTGLTSLDLLGWDTRSVTTYDSMTNMMPEALRVLVLGPNTKLKNANAFNLVQAPSWKRLSGYGVNASVTDTFPTKAALSARVAANPQGVYVDATLSGLQIEVDANGGNTDFQPALTNTTDGPGDATVPMATVLTNNKAASLFKGWYDDEGNPVTEGTVIHLAQGQYTPCRIMVVHAQWKTSKPFIGDAATHVAGNGDATFDVTATGATTLTSGTDSTNPTHSWTCMDNTCTVIGNPVAYLEATPGAQYTLTATSPGFIDPITQNPVAGGTTVKHGYLEYAKATFDGNGATVDVPAAISAFADSSTHQTVVKIPRDTIPTKGDYDVFAGWSTSSSATQADDTYNPGKPLPGTTEADKSTTLYAVWHTLAKPTITAIREPAKGNKVAVTATSKPLAAGDTIRYCISPSAVAGGSFPATCWNDTVPAGSWNGTTDYKSSHIIDKDDMPSAGHYDLTATITTSDTWRLPANSTISNTGSITNLWVMGPGFVDLPLTGSRSWRFVILLVAALVIVLTLLAAVTDLRNRKRQADHHR
ncbi:BspA family leucine-rich repeat surface protein, partial [Bifidobacterium sp. ESL0784]|uniref:BspA family leucine-rich repeat surface protein n=1 Tax=Bifidobacterium sp. ESL0784 TaxID=2983231 RepID=UPI0023F91D13